MENKERILYIDVIKAVLIFLVLWGHVIQYTNMNEGLNNPIAAFIYSFHMPMFMMLSGIFLKKQFQLQCSVLLQKNFFRLILPAVVITFSLFLIVFINKPRGLDESINWLWACRPWFVTTLFFCNVITVLLYKVIKHIGFSFLVTFILFCLLPSVSDRLIFMYPFFVLGYYMGFKLNDQRKFGPLNGGLIALLLFFACIYFRLNTSEITIYSSPYYFWSVKDGIHLDESLLIAFERYFIGFCGSVGLFYFFKNIFCGIGRKICEFKIVQYIGRNTLGLYLLQIALFTIYMGIKNEFLSNLTYHRNWLAFLLTFVIFFALLFCIKIISKYKISRTLILGES